MKYVLHSPGSSRQIDRDTLERYSEMTFTVDSSVTILTCATDDILSTAYAIIQFTNSNIPFVNGEDFREDKTKPFTMLTKISDYVEALKTITTPYVLIMDSYDAVLTDNIDNEFITSFEEFDADIVYNATPTRYPGGYICKKETGFCTHFLNAGVCFARTTVAREFYSKALELSQDGVSKSEQYYIKKTWELFDNVKIDEDRVLFTCHLSIDFESPKLIFRNERAQFPTLFHSTDTEYYLPIFEKLSTETFDIDERVSILLTKNYGYLKEQLDMANRPYKIVNDPSKISSYLQALESVDSQYLMIVDPEYSIIVNPLDNKTIKNFIRTKKEIIFGGVVYKDSLTEEERNRADKHFVCRYINPRMIFGLTNKIIDMLTVISGESDDYDEGAFVNLWIDSYEIEVDGNQSIFLCCHYDDVGYSYPIWSMHLPLPWINESDGWHIVP